MIKSFFSLLRLGIGTSGISADDIQNLIDMSMQQWREVMDLAVRQSVAAIAFDGVQKLHNVYGKKIKAIGEKHEEWMQWVFECTGLMTQYEQRSVRQKIVIKDISEIWADSDIKTMVFKGQANATFYPVPNHRATGDIDCWLFEGAEKGDSVIEKNGAVVDNRWYRHSKISYHGEMIENHRVMSHTHGSKKKQALEVELRSMLNPMDLNMIDGCGKAMMPSPQFNACFLTYHGLHHFISEGLRMKQILDWAVFLKKEQENVDWLQYNDFCKRYRLDRFAAVMNYIASEYIGVQLNSSSIKVDRTYVEKILQSTLYDDDYLFNSGKSDWTVRWLLVKNMLTKDRWKYRDVAQQNVINVLLENILGYMMKE